MRQEILGVAFDPVTADEAATAALSMMDARRAAYVCTPNPEIVMLARKNEALAEAIRRADIVLPDGAGIVWAAKRLGRAIPERTAGFDFLTALLARMEGGVYILGGKPGVAKRALENITSKYPNVTAAGFHDGYFTDEERIAAEIRAARPTLVMVCLGSPKQELFMAAHRDLPVGLMAGLGGAVDVLAGDVKRAPEAWRRRNLEWLYRLLKEPRRIKRQICLPRFVWAVLAQRIRVCKRES